VIAIEYDPNRSARIALIEYPGGQRSYILAPAQLLVGASVMSGEKAAPDVGNALPLRKIPHSRARRQGCSCCWTRGCLVEPRGRLCLGSNALRRDPANPC
jgi:hypothetical protein